MRKWLNRLGLGKPAPTAFQLLNDNAWFCKTCNKPHDGMFDLGCRAPDTWPFPRDFEPNEALRTDNHFLSEDFCVLGGEDFFVRCIFYVPVHGMQQNFGFGVWSSLSRSNFKLYADSFDDPDQDRIGRMFGYFSNSLFGFEETVPEHCDVVPQANGQRPILFLHNEEHELSLAQRDGITPERVMEIYAAYGHEVG